jgi:hypothetical protein
MGLHLWEEKMDTPKKSEIVSRKIPIILVDFLDLTLIIEDENIVSKTY